MFDASLITIFFFYGLAFFSMGLAIMLEIGRGSDARLRHALRPLAGFGLLHGLHEWIEMFELMRLFSAGELTSMLLQGARVGILAFSFLSLSAFGASLLSKTEHSRRLSMLVPLAQAALWGFGLLTIQGHYTDQIWLVADVFTRYSLAIPAAILACAGLISLQRNFRKVGMAKFGRDSLWAAIAFLWYGFFGQTFTRPSPFGPSVTINQDLFQDIFGFPVQLLRAAAAILAAIFIIRVLRSFEVETKRRIAALQNARLEEAEQREQMRSEYLKQIVAAQEAERQRIARELHDETGQALTALGLGLRGAGSTIQQSVSKATQQLKHLEGLAAHALVELQRLIADLRPSHLDDLGLAAALRWYAEEIEERSTLEVRVNIEGETRVIPPALKTALFRIVQEALGNVAKHADADHADLHLEFRDHEVMLVVADDGCGFDMSWVKGEGRKSWGIMGMKERATLLKGEFDIESKVGEGTRVSVIIPYDQRVEAPDDDTAVVG
jgi:signal transduction histidine kinase